MAFLKTFQSKFQRYYNLHHPYIFIDEAIYEKFQARNVRRIIHGYLGDITVSNKEIKPLLPIKKG